MQKPPEVAGGWQPAELKPRGAIQASGEKLDKPAILKDKKGTRSISAEPGHPQITYDFGEKRNVATVTAVRIYDTSGLIEGDIFRDAIYANESVFVNVDKDELSVTLMRDGQQHHYLMDLTSPEAQQLVEFIGFKPAEINWPRWVTVKGKPITLDRATPTARVETKPPAEKLTKPAPAPALETPEPVKRFEVSVTAIRPDIKLPSIPEPLPPGTTVVPQELFHALGPAITVALKLSANPVLTRFLNIIADRGNYNLRTYAGKPYYVVETQIYTNVLATLSRTMQELALHVQRLDTIKDPRKQDDAAWQISRDNSGSGYLSSYEMKTDQQYLQKFMENIRLYYPHN